MNASWRSSRNLHILVKAFGDQQSAFSKILKKQLVKLRAEG